MNEIISLALYAEVLERTNMGIICRDLNSGQEICLSSPSHGLRVNSADTFNEIRRITKTEMAELIVDSCCDVFTVTFIKQGGQERVLRGRLISSESLLGRVMVEDLDLLNVGLNSYRQVDLRTIKELIIRGVKYVIKS